MDPINRLLTLAQTAADLATKEMERGEYEVANGHIAAAAAYNNAARAAQITPDYQGLEASDGGVSPSAFVAPETWGSVEIAMHLADCEARETLRLETKARFEMET